ncbi:Cyclin-D5-1 [Sesamum alatum]|uniref:Cyclin-D5-1 n=1 Tax=Sesamum alatum TaxID=300844 RepID=A0AAE1Y9Y5_9LAMI|nr:Cyclin-D5-1 [Sesamum alatum]
MESETPSPNLLCSEDESSLNEQKDENLEFCSVSESDCEFIETLFQRETSFRSIKIGSTRSRSKCCRLDAVKWILDTRALFGYHHRTAYLSVIYFDLFFARTEYSDGIPWLVRLLSVACLSLAAKMEECRVRALTEYCVEGFKFQTNVIQRMELMVLNTLEWTMGSATPFTYLNYFVSKFCGESRHRQVKLRASELILAVIEEINVVEHRPSVIAAAAVLAAYDYRLTKTTLENKIEAVLSWGSLEKEHVFSCYSLLQEILMLKTPKTTISPNSLSNYSTVISRDSIKRGLTFDDSSQVHKLSKR